MMLLYASKPDILEHWKNTVTALNTVLPERPGGYTGRSTADGLAVELVLRSADNEIALRHNDRPVPVVPFLDGLRDGSETYWLAWHEAWRVPQLSGKTRKGNLQFRSSSLTVYVGEIGAAKTQTLRAEWAGAEVQSGTTAIVFQGGGAAHPHWHLSVLHGIEDGEIPRDGTRSSLTEETEASTTFAILEARLRSLDPAWAGVHLAVSARWAEFEWPGPEGPHDMHAQNPTSLNQIRTWIVSCTRYLQSELQAQLQRGRQ